MCAFLGMGRQCTWYSLPSRRDPLAALQGRMTDSNRNLAAKVLQLLGDIARAMGPVSGHGVSALSLLCTAVVGAQVCRLSVSSCVRCGPVRPPIVFCQTSFPNNPAFPCSHLTRARARCSSLPWPTCRTTRSRQAQVCRFSRSAVHEGRLAC